MDKTKVKQEQSEDENLSDFVESESGEEEVEEDEDDGYQRLTISSAPPDHDYFSQQYVSQGISEESLPKLEIVEEPIGLIRFRYLSELQGTPHGPLLGTNSTKLKRTFPVVQLKNWTGEAQIRCWLVCLENNVPVPHIHDLVCRKNRNIMEEPHYRTVSKSNNYTARFDNLVILRTAKKNGIEKYYRKRLMFESNFCELEYDKFKPTRKETEILEGQLSSMDKNIVYLFFEAITIVKNKIKRLCRITSNPVRNLKDPVSSELRIVKSSRHAGSCEGGDEILIFVRKIPKDIKIEFIEKDSNGEIIWSQYADFTPSDVHFDYGVSFLTPPYKEVVTDGREVTFRLHRMWDKAYSNEMPFIYCPPISDARLKKMSLSSDYLTQLLMSDIEIKQETDDNEYEEIIIMKR